MYLVTIITASLHAPAPAPAADAGLSGKVSKQQALALTDKLKALSRSTAVGGLQPYRSHDGAAGAAPAHWQKAQGDAAMTAEQVQEQRELDKQMEQVGIACRRVCKTPSNRALRQTVQALSAALLQWQLSCCQSQQFPNCHEGAGWQVANCGPCSSFCTRNRLLLRHVRDSQHRVPTKQLQPAE